MLAALKHAETAVNSEFIIDPACRWFGSVKSVDGGAGEVGGRAVRAVLLFTETKRVPL